LRDVGAFSLFLLFVLNTSFSIIGALCVVFLLTQSGGGPTVSLPPRLSSFSDHHSASRHFRSFFWVRSSARFLFLQASSFPRTARIFAVSAATLEAWLPVSTVPSPDHVEAPSSFRSPPVALSFTMHRSDGKTCTLRLFLQPKNNRHSLDPLPAFFFPDVLVRRLTFFRPPFPTAFPRANLHIGDLPRPVVTAGALLIGSRAGFLVLSFLPDFATTCPHLSIPSPCRRSPLIALPPRRVSAHCLPFPQFHALT